jgi:ectoine hydroxylase-related dioxygenase (phytanoyl-CoA dioxygenase family)
MTQKIWLDEADIDLAAFEALLDAGRDAPKPPLASELVQGVPIYELGRRRIDVMAEADRRALMAEWHRVLAGGAGVLVLRGTFDDHAMLGDMTAAFFALIERERALGHGGDHFAKPGANDRVWNALQKICLAEPALFARYYGNAALAAVCEAWLGPGWQMTSQINCVNPGGQAQRPHRDYHLGFATPAQALRWPTAVHSLSPCLTLQGAVAHVDMPLESGPTLLLPHSQKFIAGYLLAGRPEFDACFANRHAQLPLAAGDAVFFNPALMHAAGTNRSTAIRRLGNLLQVSSAYGRAMESVDRVAMSLALYPALLAELTTGRLGDADARHAIASCAEGYAFPTNLDLDPPIGGLAPPSQQDLMRQALAERWPADRFAAQLQAREASRQA